MLGKEPAVVVSGDKSNWQLVTSGVPYESVLESVLLIESFSYTLGAIESSGYLAIRSAL